MSRDVLGFRQKFGVIGPSTNTIVQPDFEAMRPFGVTNHYSRIFTPDTQAMSNESFIAGAKLIGQNTLDAVRSVLTCAPDHLVMGMSAVTFFDGKRGRMPSRKRWRICRGSAFRSAAIPAPWR